MHMQNLQHSGSITRNACRLRNIAMHDYQESVTTGQTQGQTDARQSDPYVKLCFAGDTKTTSSIHLPVSMQYHTRESISRGFGGGVGGGREVKTTLGLWNSVKVGGGRVICVSQIYRISGIFCVRKFWQKCHLEGVLNFHRVLFSLDQGLSMKTYSRVYFSLCLFLAISPRSRTQQKFNPSEKISDIQYLVITKESLQFVSQVKAYNHPEI